MEPELRAKIQAARIAHHERPTEESAGKVKALQQELNDYLADGAKPCDCGAVPHVMLRREVPISGVMARLYEAGCLTCRITNGDLDEQGNPIAYPRRAQGISAAEAVANWNNGKLVFIRPAMRLVKVKADGSQEVLKKFPMAKLTTAQRKKLPKSKFGLPGKKAYPMPDKSHAANAKARASQAVNAGRMSTTTEKKIDAKANRGLGKRRGLLD